QNIARITDGQCLLLTSRSALALPDHGRALIGHGDVEHPKLHAFGALPTVHRERSRDMQWLAAILRQRVAELLSDRAERDAIDDRAVAGFEPHAQMRLAYLIGIDQLVCRQRNDGLRIAGAERPGPAERPGEFRRPRTSA